MVTGTEGHIKFFVTSLIFSPVKKLTYNRTSSPKNNGICDINLLV